MALRNIEIFDTTLRDGEQAPGNTLNPRQKLKIAEKLEELKIDIIEAGFPVSSNDDFKAVQLISRKIKRSRIAALARCKVGDIDSARESLKDAKNPILHLFYPTSNLHLDVKFKLSPKESLEVVDKCLNYASKYFKYIILSSEDATRSDKKHLINFFKVGMKYPQVKVFDLADTTGYAQPKEIFELVRLIRKKFPNKKVGMHCHNDLGLGVANSLAAISAGANHIQLTINGIGERAGNAALEEVIMGLHQRKDFYGVSTKIDLSKLYETSKLVYSLLKRKASYEKPIVGKNSFRHEAGIHVSAMKKDKKTYEIIESTRLKRKSKFIIGKHSSNKKKKIRGH